MQRRQRMWKAPCIASAEETSELAAGSPRFLLSLRKVKPMCAFARDSLVAKLATLLKRSDRAVPQPRSCGSR